MIKAALKYILLLICSLNSIVYGQNDKPLFEVVDPQTSNVSFANTQNLSKTLNAYTYYDFYNGGGVAIGDINNDGLQDIYLTGNTLASNKLYLNKGNFVFEDITNKAGVAGTADWCSGVTMADVNGDGYIDIYVSAVNDSATLNLKGKNQLYINNGDNTFTDQASAYGLAIADYTSQAAFFDYDHDGDLDCFVLSQSTTLNNNKFRPSTDRDSIDNKKISRMFRNELSTGKNKFVDVSRAAGIFQSDLGFGLGIMVADVNNDGWEDVYITNDFYEDDYYYVNNGDGSFSEKGKSTFNHYSTYSMGIDIADINNDAQLDVITLDMLPEDEAVLKTQDISRPYYMYKNVNEKLGYHPQNVKNCLHINNGNGTSFSEIALQSQVAATDWSWAPLFADFDNDGNKDLMVSSGIYKSTNDLDFIHYTPKLHAKKQDSVDFNLYLTSQLPFIPSHPYLFKGDGKGDFKDASKTWGVEYLKGFTSGAAYADLDNDGDLDIVLSSNNDTTLILKNILKNSNYISFSFKSNGLNTSAIGTKVYLYANNKVQYQQLMPTRGYQSSVAPRLNFGLGDATEIDSVVIVWPNQQQNVLRNISANQHHILKEGEKSAPFVYEAYFPTKQDIYEEVTDEIALNWKHEEGIIIDYYNQPLIPQVKSNRGPKVAVGDVNHDGLDDFYVCGATLHPGVLFQQDNKGNFIPTNATLFQKDSVAENVDAIFIDADNDGDQDLYVVCGGNSFQNGSAALVDLLYINDGDGNFTKSDSSLQYVARDKSCVTIADIDNDGDKDMFVGGFVNPEYYGQAQTSYVLRNNGKGVFEVIEKFFLGLGMVTDAQFADVNNDGIKDIVVVGEWMPITIFIVNSQGVTKTTIPNSTGLWQSVFVDDVNGDGNNDLIIGNWGHNNKFWSNKTPPLRLYHGDFTNNKRAEQLLTYVYKGKEYTFLGLQGIEQSMPEVRKKHLLYSKFASKTFNQVFGDIVKDAKPLIAERLGSVICYGNGNGEFNMVDLPKGLQKAPINVISKGSNKNQYLFGGNLFETRPLEGRYDAQALTIANYKEGRFITESQINFDALKGQVKGLVWINTVKHGKVLIVARNDEKLLFYKPIN